MNIQNTLYWASGQPVIESYFYYKTLINNAFHKYQMADIEWIRFPATLITLPPLII